MRIMVCLKEVLDPEIPPRAFTLDETRTKPLVVGVPASDVVDSYAENALETAIQLRDVVPGCTVTALCVGDSGSDAVLRRAFAFTANDCVRAWSPEWEGADGLVVAHVLAGAIRAIGGADLILCGRQAADVEEGLVGPALAEELGIPCVTLANRISPRDDDILRIVREADGVLETVEVSPPVVITIASAENNVPRLPKIRDVMLARSKSIRVLGTGDLELDDQRLKKGVELRRMTIAGRENNCRILGNGDNVDGAAELARALRELKVL